VIRGSLETLQSTLPRSRLLWELLVPDGD
jgi:hypothetical protein